MSPDLLLALALFAFVSSITPGPNNLMLLASGLNFGFRASLRHMLGISIGFGLMLSALGLGLNAVLTEWPLVYTVLRFACIAYLLLLAWRLATAGSLSLDGRAAAQPMGFWAAAAFQWVNPKAWVMALSALTTYAQAGSLQAVGWTALVCMAVNLPSIATWALCGSQLRHWLSDPKRQRLFNRVMAALLVLSMAPMLPSGAGSLL